MARTPSALPYSPTCIAQFDLCISYQIHNEEYERITAGQLARHHQHCQYHQDDHYQHHHQSGANMCMRKLDTKCIVRIIRIITSSMAASSEWRASKRRRSASRASKERSTSLHLTLHLSVHLLYFPSWWGWKVLQDSTWCTNLPLRLRTAKAEHLEFSREGRWILPHTPPLPHLTKTKTKTNTNTKTKMNPPPHPFSSSSGSQHHQI